MQVIRWLKEIDYSLFFLINKRLSFSWLDNIMLILRQAYTWIPLYLFFLLFFYANCRKVLLPVIILSALTFSITDFASASILKPLIGRLRPCHDPLIEASINNIAACGGMFGMPSSHASNHFGLATFWFLIIKHTVAQKWYWLWLWATLICYSQVYAGVHFPGDIFAGALLGVAVGNFTYYLFRRWTKTSHPAVEPDF